MSYAVIINYFGKNFFFPITRKWGKKLFEASHLVCFYSEQKEREKEIFKLNTTQFKLINP